MTTSNSKVALLDTNILVYTADASAKPFHSASKLLVERGLRGEITPESPAASTRFEYFKIWKCGT